MKVFIVAAKRTAIGKFMGSLTSLSPAALCVPVIKSILADTKIDPAVIDEVIVGNILMAGQKQGVARQAVVMAGIPYSVPAYGLNMICGSGMKSVINAYRSIKSGDAQVILAGGTENMSGAGFVLPGATVRNGQKMGDFNVTDHMVCDGLTDAFAGYHMGITAENIAQQYHISREDQDAFSWRSQQKAMAAVDAGKFREEIVPVDIVTKKETVRFDTDEFPNRATSPEKLAQLKPAFKKDGTVTAGNASGLNDGASFVLVASEAAVQQYNLTPLVEIIATGQGGVDPAIMGMGPVPAIADALQKAGLKLADMQLLELNEAFAAQSIGVMHQLCVDHHIDCEKLRAMTNVNGGAIALGHPIGASGNRITVTLVHEMLKANVRYGLAALCIGGGMGTAVVLKR